jgi:hypothetical protein
VILAVDDESTQILSDSFELCLQEEVLSDLDVDGVVDPQIE